MKRKEFIKTSGLAAASQALLPTGKLCARSPEKQIKMGIIGIGFSGKAHLKLLLMRSNMAVVAICNIADPRLTDEKE